MSVPSRKTDKAIQPYGYIRSDNYIDTRQVVGSSNGLRLFYPAPFKCDPYCIDINDKATATTTAIQSRFGCLLHGQDWTDPEINGRFECDFRGSTATRRHGLVRIRHAFFKISTESLSFLCGQTWNPLVITTYCYPGVVSVNSGVPFTCNLRSPQLRLTYDNNIWSAMIVYIGPSPFQSTAPFLGETDREYIPHEPEIHGRLTFYGNRSAIGCGANYKILMPRIETKKDFATRSNIKSFIGQIFGTYSWNHTRIQGQFLYGQNGVDLDLVSTYAIQSLVKKTDQRTYEPTTQIASWIDIFYRFYHESMECGVYVAGSKNIGTGEQLYIDPKTHKPIVFSFRKSSARINNLARISPRFVYYNTPLKIGLEIEYTRASFGNLTSTARVTNSQPVHVVRLLSTFHYMF
jgi:hypothetical protein